MSRESDWRDVAYKGAYDAWIQIVDLSLYDDRTVIHNATDPLEEALGLDPDHIPSLKLLSVILMENDLYDRAEPVVDRLVRLQPDVQEHQTKLDLLRSRDRNAIKDFIEDGLLRPK